MNVLNRTKVLKLNQLTCSDGAVPASRESLRPDKHCNNKEKINNYTNSRSAQTNPGSTQVKTNPGCVYTTICKLTRIEPGVDIVVKD